MEARHNTGGIAQRQPRQLRMLLKRFGTGETKPETMPPNFDSARIQLSACVTTHTNNLRKMSQQIGVRLLLTAHKAATCCSRRSWAERERRSGVEEQQPQPTILRNWHPAGNWDLANSGNQAKTCVINPDNPVKPMVLFGLKNRQVVTQKHISRGDTKQKRTWKTGTETARQNHHFTVYHPTYT